MKTDFTRPKRFCFVKIIFFETTLSRSQSTVKEKLKFSCDFLNVNDQVMI